jgi:ABC-type thiamin/hydroxymethylpyrimidine transport system permease subunit
MRFTTRDLVMLGIFGALWGGVEISLGSLFHTLNLPMTGMLLSAIGLMVVLVGRYYVPRVGSTFFLGVIAALLKMLSLGGIVIWPMIAILMEALVAEIILTLFGKPSRVSFLVGGSLGVLYTLVHPFFSQGLLAGQGMVFVWELLVERGLQIFGLSMTAAWVVVGLYTLLHLVTGLLAGWLAWEIARALQGRLRRSLPEAINESEAK